MKVTLGKKNWFPKGIVLKYEKSLKEKVIKRFLPYLSGPGDCIDLIIFENSLACYYIVYIETFVIVSV